MLAFGEVRAGVVNKFLGVPRNGFVQTEARFRFEVITSGLQFADLFDSLDASSDSSASVVAAGIGFVVPGCPGCISDYRFEEVVKLGSDRRSIADRVTIEGVIPV